MNLTIEMPWERDLSVNAYRFGRPAPGQKFRRRKPHVQGWMKDLELWVWFERRVYDGEIIPKSWPPIINLPVNVVVHFRFPDNRRRDDHNSHKVICDSVATGLGIDDKDIRISTGSVTVDKANPGFSIELSDETER